MFHRRTIALAVLLALSGLAHAGKHDSRHDARALAEDPRLAEGQLAPILSGLGDHHHAVTTDSERAQIFFDQGLKLTYGFNHQEALRAFKEAARLDPDCAMAYWGWALVLGPNLNLPMTEEVVPQAWEAIQTALEKKSKVSEKEQDYIDALARRFTDDPKADRAPLDRAYAEAMARLHEKYPEDNDAATLYAAALMKLSPWNYWTADGQPRADTETLLAVLERVIENDPHHEGALHYYIHAVESVDPDRGEPAADLLRGLAPGAGHLIHMPSHIYLQTGRYAEGFEDNVLAARADEAYITQCRAQGLYPLTYYPHNVHFIAWAAIMQGRSREALAASRKTAAQVPDDRHDNVWGLYQTFLSMPYYTMVRFGMWDEILAEPIPNEKLTYGYGIAHYARGMAFRYTEKQDEARNELAALEAIVADPETAEVIIGFSQAAKLLTIAAEILGGEISAGEGDTDTAILRLDRAVRLEDSLLYNEPPDWYFPTRHILGAVLLDAGRPVEAEVVYLADLRKNRENGYALLGLAQAMHAQGREGEGAETMARFKRAWAAADRDLTSSRF